MARFVPPLRVSSGRSNGERRILEWLSRLYVLTDKRMIAVAGVLRQGVSDVPLRNVRNLVIVRGVMDRLHSLLVAAPVAWFAMFLMVPGG